MTPSCSTSTCRTAPSTQLAGWRRTEVALLPPRTLASAELTPKLGHDDAYDVQMDWGDPIELPGRHRQRRRRGGLRRA